VFFQEEVWASGFDQTRDVVPLEWNVVHSVGRSADEASGISVASHWPLELIEEIDLTAGGPPVDEFVWAALIVRVTTPSGPVVVVNHFPDAAVDREDERERQALLVARRVAAVCDPDVPVVLGGDLDAEPEAGSMRFLTGLQTIDGHSVSYQRAWDATHRFDRCVTIDPERNPLASGMRGWPYRQIDHLLVRSGRDGLAGLRIESCSRVHDEPIGGVWASDHFGLVAELTDLRSIRDSMSLAPSQIGG
jgi:endonuclease/exonuclease/phosphatase family metal-dependent hydrolase